MSKFVIGLFIILVCSIQNMALAEEEYLLGAGDIVRISVYGQNDLSTVARINESNKISFPLVGDVEVGGQTASQAEAKISTALSKGGFVRSPQVSVIIEQYRSRQVSILGYVNKPAKYTIDTPSRLIDIIALAGGITRDGSDVVKLVRVDAKGKSTNMDINLQSMFKTGDMSKNVDIKNADIIYVPQMERFYIYGQVNRPGVYRLESGMTVMQGLAVGGGVTMKGTERNIRITRHGSDGKLTELTADVSDALRQDDVIYVKESLF